MKWWYNYRHVWVSELVLVESIIIMSSHPGIRIWIEYRVFEYLPPLPAGDRVGRRVGVFWHSLHPRHSGDLHVSRVQKISHLPVGDRDGSFVGCLVGDRDGSSVGSSVGCLVGFSVGACWATTPPVRVDVAMKTIAAMVHRTKKEQRIIILRYVEFLSFT